MQNKSSQNKEEYKVNTANGAESTGRKGKSLKERRQKLFKLKFKV